MDWNLKLKKTGKKALYRIGKRITLRAEWKTGSEGDFKHMMLYSSGFCDIYREGV